MKSQSAADDRISESPDEILHCILRRLESSKAAAQTTALSRRWRDVWPDFWRSYPVVQFDVKEMNQSAEFSQSFEKFCDATIDRFSRNSLLRMEALKLTLTAGNGRVAELLDLATQRKAEKVEVAIIAIDRRRRLILPFRSLSNPSAKILKFEGVRFARSSEDDDLDLPLNLNSLRFLRFYLVYLRDSHHWANLIASCPLLETLELIFTNFKNISSVRDLRHLKKLKISDICKSVHEIEIAASQLETLHLGHAGTLYRFELTAPRLVRLAISDTRFTASDLESVIWNHQSLKSLTLARIGLVDGTKLKLWCPKLEEFTLDTPQFEEFELNAGPDLPKFSLRIHGRKSLDILKKCRVRPACRWKLDFVHENVSYAAFAALKIFLARFTLFTTVCITSVFGSMVRFMEEMAEYVTPPTYVKHLKIRENSYMGDGEKAYLNGLLWALRPKFLTIVYNYRSDYDLHRYLTSKAATPSENDSRGMKPHQLCNWRRWLKDVEIVYRVRDTDRAVMHKVGEDTVRRAVCYMLTWG